MPSHAKRLILVCLGSVFLMCGCQDYKWQWSFQSPDQIQALEQRTAQQHKLVFIFYKSSLNDRMHSEVLADNQVGALFQDTTNVMIDKFSAGPAYENYMTRYGVTAPPACVLVGPDGRYKVFAGHIPKDRFIEMVKAAKVELAAKAEPTEPPRHPPPGKPVP